MSIGGLDWMCDCEMSRVLERVYISSCGFLWTWVARSLMLIIWQWDFQKAKAGLTGGVQWGSSNQQTSYQGDIIHHLVYEVLSHP